MFRLKTAIICLRLLVIFLLLRPFGNIIHDFAAKYEALSIRDLRKLEKLSIKTANAELDVNFLNNCLTFQVFPNFICFPLPNTKGVYLNLLPPKNGK